MADAHPPKEDKKEEKKVEKKSFSQILVDIAVKILLIVIFLFVVGALLDMLFPAVSGIIRSTGNGLTSMGTELLRVTASMGVFTGSVAGIVARLLFLFVIVVVAGKLAKAIGNWAKT